MLAPFIPFSSAKILAAFGRDLRQVEWNDAIAFDLKGCPLAQPEILFQKLGVMPQAK
jgi:methionyl-tRNA synthetase